MTLRSSLKSRLAAGETILAPGAYDPMSARLVQSLGFDTVYVGGYMSGAHLAVTEPLMTLTEQVEVAERVAKSVNLPVLCDAGAGYGDPVHTMHTVRTFERAGICGIHIEDQVFPKRASYHAGLEHVIPIDEFLEKMRYALEARSDPDFLIIGRTDSFTAVEGDLDDAIRRGNALRDLGVDVVMPRGVRQREDLATFRAGVPDVPLLVIAAMMGIETYDRQFIRSLAEKLLFIGRGNADRMQPLTEGITELQEYLRPMVKERLKNPNGDLLDKMTDAARSTNAAGKRIMDEEQVVANAILLLLAGHETTINLICNGTRAFMTHPEQWELFKTDPAGRMIRATEECLRYDPPVKSITRIAGEDVELGDKLIKKDERMRWFVTSANRDPEVFDRPDDFDIERYPNPHVAFGSGIHHCLGATLARLEGQEAFKAIAERFPNLNITVDPDDLTYTSSITFRTLERLPVSLS